MRLLLDLNLSELKTYFTNIGQPEFRAIQVWEGLYKHFWTSTDQFSQLPIGLRNHIDNDFIVKSLDPIMTQSSRDKNTTKTLFKLRDGKAIEAVLMEYNTRRTACISTQIGCSVGCVFCATGQMGFSRNLTSGEIIAQVLYYANQLHIRQERLTNIVLMGMGEPFHNYENSLTAISRLNDKQGCEFSERRFTISTIGIIPSINKFTSENRQVNLSVSLHAATDSIRSSLIPIAIKYPLEELLSACREYTLNTGRRISFEWALIHGVNDTFEQAHLLVKRLRGLLCHVNLIPMNPIAGFLGKTTTHERAVDFSKILTHHRIPCTIRIRRGIDIQAGCGQLVTAKQ